MSIFGRLFGSAKSTMAAVDVAKRAGDALFFTNEEKSAADDKLRDWFLQYLAATEPQTLARRFIAIAITLLWCVLCLAAVIAWPLSPGYAEYILQILVDVAGLPFAGIMAFYFTTSLVRTYRKGQ